MEEKNHTSQKVYSPCTFASPSPQKSQHCNVVKIADNVLRNTKNNKKELEALFKTYPKTLHNDYVCFVLLGSMPTSKKEKERLYKKEIPFSKQKITIHGIRKPLFTHILMALTTCDRHFEEVDFFTFDATDNTYKEITKKQHGGLPKGKIIKKIICGNCVFKKAYTRVNIGTDHLTKSAIVIGTRNKKDTEAIRKIGALSPTKNKSND